MHSSLQPKPKGAKSVGRVFYLGQQGLLTHFWSDAVVASCGDYTSVAGIAAFVRHEFLADV